MRDRRNPCDFSGQITLRAPKGLTPVLCNFIHINPHPCRLALHIEVFSHEVLMLILGGKPS